MNGWTGDDISGFHESASSAREGFGIGDHFGALVTGDIPAKPPTSDNDVALFSSTHARRLSRPDATRPALPRRTSSQVRALFIRAREIVEAVESEDEVQLCNSLSSLLAVCGETYEHDSELDPFHQTV